MLQGMKRGEGFGLLDLGRKSFFFSFFKKMLMSSSLHGMINVLYFHYLLSAKSLSISSPLVLGGFILKVAAGW